MVPHPASLDPHRNAAGDRSPERRQNIAALNRI
jgi:hypothetical protein